jgi:hypothetical protein
MKLSCVAVCLVNRKKPKMFINPLPKRTNQAKLKKVSKALNNTNKQTNKKYTNKQTNNNMYCNQPNTTKCSDKNNRKAFANL